MVNLDRIVGLWPLLPPHIQEAILALVDATDPSQNGWVSKREPTVHAAAMRGSRKSQNNRATLASTILKALRHSPEIFSLGMDFDGWVREFEFRNFVAQLLEHDDSLQRMPLDEILSNLELSDRVQTKLGFVRAAYGHSTHRFAPTTSAIPDQPLYHGTSARSWSMIDVKFYSTGAHVWQATTIPTICLQVWMDDAFELDEPLF